MNGVLSALVVVAANTSPTDPLTATLSAAIPAVAGAAIGYLFGTMRDWSKSKAERNAKHQDQVLESITELLSGADQVVKAAYAVAHSRLSMKKGRHVEPGPEAVEALENFLHKSEELSAAHETTRPHTLRISILAPRLSMYAHEAVETAVRISSTDYTTEPNPLLTAHETAKQDLVNAAQDYLRVQTRRQKMR